MHIDQEFMRVDYSDYLHQLCQLIYVSYRIFPKTLQATNINTKASFVMEVQYLPVIHQTVITGGNLIMKNISFNTHAITN